MVGAGLIFNQINQTQSLGFAIDMLPKRLHSFSEGPLSLVI